MNRYEISGRLTRDAVVTSAGGMARVEFTVGVADVAYDPEQRRDVVETTYVVVIATGAIASVLASGGGLGKGSEVYSVGRLAQVEVERPGNRTERKTRLLATTLLVTTHRSPRPPDAEPTSAPKAPPDDPWSPRDGS